MQISDEVLETAIVAYGQTKTGRANRERLRRALEAACDVAYREGYAKGIEAAEYNDTGIPR